jgi:hypothetical protein
MYPQTTVDIARQLSDIGILDRENAQICGVSIRSIRHWRSGDRRSQRGGRAGVRKSPPNCPRCHGRPLDETAYAYLLGPYLGDGHITQGPRSYTLWLACADAWPGLLQQARQAVANVMPSSAVFCASKRSEACTYVKSVSSTGHACSHSMVPDGSTSAASSWSRGRRRSWPSTPATSRAVFPLRWMPWDQPGGGRAGDDARSLT